MDWDDITSDGIGKTPVCIVGAGFQKAVLKNAMPSTEDIVKETVQKEEIQFPILSILYEKNLEHAQ